MAWVDRLKSRKLTAAALVGAVLGCLIGLFLPIRAAAPTKSDQGAWALPNAQALKRFREDEFRGLFPARFWGELARPGQRQSRTQANWTLHAIVTRPYVQVAISEAGKPAQTWIRLGGELPDGSKLVRVTRDGVQFEKDGCRRARPLYPVTDPNKPKTDTDACIGAAPAVDATSAPAQAQSGA